MATLKNSFWYAWHRQRSRVEAVYAPLAAVPYWPRMFDVVVAGAILEHLPDPVTAIWSMTQRARETVIVAFTPVDPDETLRMRAANTWDNPAHNYTWWTLSAGLYRQVFANVGFSTTFTTAHAMLNGVLHARPTIVAHRIRG